jgi:hypothetical protein
VLKVQVDTNKFSVVLKILGIIVPHPAQIKLSSSMKHSEQLWDQSSYLFNEYWSTFPQGKTMDHHSNHSSSFLHLWMCGATPLLIPYPHDMVSNLWNLMSGVSIMQCHTQTPNIRLRWLHLMAFLKQISFKFWSSLAFTGHLVQATSSYA